MNIEVLDWVIFSGNITLSILIMTLAVKFKSLSRELKLYTFILICHLLTTLISLVLYKAKLNPNSATSVFYTFTIVAYARFFLTVTPSHSLRSFLFIIVPAHVLFGVANMFFIQKGTLNTYSGISFGLIVTFLCLHYFYSLLKNLPSENLLGLPLFWIITAEFMVNTGQIVFKSFAHFLIRLFHDNLIVLWVFHHSLGIVGHLFIFYGLWQHFRKSSTTYSAEG